MPIDAGIFQNFLRPPKTVQEYDNEAMQAQGNALSLQNQRMQLDQAKLGQQDEQNLRNALAGGLDIKTPEGQAALWRAAPGKAGAIIKNQADIAKLQQATLESKSKSSNYDSEVRTRDFALQQAKTQQHLQQLVGVNSVQAAHQWLDEAAASGELPADKVAAKKQELAQNPAMLNQWKQQAMMGGLTVVQQREDEAKRLQLEETTRNNKAQNGIAMRGQNMADARAREATQATMSKPFEVTGQDGQPLLVQQDKQGNIKPVQGYGPKPAAPNAAQQKELMSINQQRSILNGALQSVQSTPSAFSFKRGIGGKMPFGESIAGRMETPEETQARSYVFNNVSRVINERAGAAQSAQELARLNTFLPADTDNAQQITNKINGFNQYLNDLEAGTKGTPKQATQPGPKVGAIEDGHRFKGGDPANPSNWEKVK